MSSNAGPNTKEGASQKRTSNAKGGRNTPTNNLVDPSQVLKLVGRFRPLLDNGKVLSVDVKFLKGGSVTIVTLPNLENSGSTEFTVEGAFRELRKREQSLKKEAAAQSLPTPAPAATAAEEKVKAPQGASTADWRTNPGSFSKRFETRLNAPCTWVSDVSDIEETLSRAGPFLLEAMSLSVSEFRKKFFRFKLGAQLYEDRPSPEGWDAFRAFLSETSTSIPAENAPQVVADAAAGTSIEAQAAAESQEAN